jgi:hypothetical protein
MMKDHFPQVSTRIPWLTEARLTRLDTLAVGYSLPPLLVLTSLDKFPIFSGDNHDNFQPSRRLWNWPPRPLRRQ